MINDPSQSTVETFIVAEQQLAPDALTEWARISGLIFIEVAIVRDNINFQKLYFTGSGHCRVAYLPFGDWNYFTYPNFSPDRDAAGDVCMHAAQPMVYGTLLHGIGHTLGIRHPTEAWTNNSAAPDVVTSGNPAFSFVGTPLRKMRTIRYAMTSGGQMARCRLMPTMTGSLTTR